MRRHCCRPDRRRRAHGGRPDRPRGPGRRPQGDGRRARCARRRSPARRLSAAAGTPVALKAECLQGTGSFKLRGALSKVAALGERASAGLVTASAGNHARAVAQAARLTGRRAARCSCRATRRCRRWPRWSGWARTSSWRARRWRRRSGWLDERAESSGAALVHPFDDLDVIAGQGTLGARAARGRARSGARGRAGRRRRPGERHRHRAAPRGRGGGAGGRAGARVRAVRARAA